MEILICLKFTNFGHLRSFRKRKKTIYLEDTLETVPQQLFENVECSQTVCFLQIVSIDRKVWSRELNLRRICNLCSIDNISCHNFILLIPFAYPSVSFPLSPLYLSISISIPFPFYFIPLSFNPSISFSFYLSLTPPLLLL